MRAYETKTNYTILSTNTCKIFFQPLDVEEPNLFNGSIFIKVPIAVLRMPHVRKRTLPPPPAKNRLMILSRCPITRERVTTQSGGVQSNPEYRQSKLRYPLGFTVIGCLHKQKDPIKPKDLITVAYIWLLFSGFILCLTFLKRVSKREMVKSSTLHYIFGVS